VGIIIGTTQLDINPIFLSGVIVHDIPRVGQIRGKAWLRNIPLRTEKWKKKLGINEATKKHKLKKKFTRWRVKCRRMKNSSWKIYGMNSSPLHSCDRQSVKILIENLALKC
jgi:hypothetical protein